MDMALAIWQIDPSYEYTLANDKSEINEWRAGVPQPDQATLEAAWMACPMSFDVYIDGSVGSNKAGEIIGDGVDSISVTVRMPTLGGTGSVDVKINDDVYPIAAETFDTLGYGYTEIELTSEYPDSQIEVKGNDVKYSEIEPVVIEVK